MRIFIKKYSEIEKQEEFFRENFEKKNCTSDIEIIQHEDQEWFKIQEFTCQFDPCSRMSLLSKNLALTILTGGFKLLSEKCRHNWKISFKGKQIRSIYCTYRIKNQFIASQQVGDQCYRNPFPVIKKLPDLALEQVLKYLEQKEIENLLQTSKKISKSSLILGFYLKQFSSEIKIEQRLNLACMLRDKITSLNLRCSGISLEYLKKIKQLHKLKIVYYIPYINYLNFLPESVEELNLKNCYEFIEEEEHREEEKIKLPNLKSVSLSYALIKRIPNFPFTLRELNIERADDIPSKEFKKLRSFIHLTYLNIAYTNIRNLAHLPQSLKTLNLRGCQLEKEEFEKLIDLVNLTDLNIGMTTINNLSYLPKSLKILSLNDCEKIKLEEGKKLMRLTNLIKLTFNFKFMNILIDFPRNLREVVLCTNDQRIKEKREQMIIFKKLNPYIKFELKDFKVYL